MTHEYTISGMTCNSCVAKVKKALEAVPFIESAEVKLDHPQATIRMQQHVSLPELSRAVAAAGAYTIAEVNGMPSHHFEPVAEEPTSWLATYKPLLIVMAFILGISLLAEVKAGGFMIERWMSHFMAGFFISFSLFKMLDLKGFSESYASYDIISQRWMGWGYVYAFIELALGLAFLFGFNPLLTNAITFVVMSISLIGVLKSVLKKRQIRCACLGAVFNLPMSTVTIAEDATMIAMSAAMIITLY
jgi:copper chaperone CopZ